MEPVPCLQCPVTGSYPEPGESNSRISAIFPNVHFNVILPSTLMSS
jgi:hypothetical protein